MICCCGKTTVDPEFAATIHNDYQHEPLGPPGNFCGPVITHTVRDLRKQLAEVEASRARFEASLEHAVSRVIRLEESLRDSIAVMESAAADYSHFWKDSEAHVRRYIAKAKHALEEQVFTAFALPSNALPTEDDRRKAIASSVRSAEAMVNEAARLLTLRGSCWKCGGHGEVPDHDLHWTMKCPECKGTGKEQPR